MTAQKTPHLLLETSSLLTLLLGGSSRLLGNGYLQLIEEMAKKGLVKLDTSDMVVSEFLGVCGPVYEGDLRGSTTRLQEKNVPYGYALRGERYKVLKHWVDTGLLTIHKTKCGDEYLQRIHSVLQHNPQLHLQKYGKEWPISIDTLRHALLSPGTNISRAVKDERIFADRMQKHKLHSGAPDRGEISLGDALTEIGRKEAGAKCFVLFEGRDVRGRIIWRMKEPDNDQLIEALPDQYNPNSDVYSLAEDDARALGDINFVSTKGFLAGIAYAGMKIDNGDRKGDKRKYYIISQDEAESQEAFKAAYGSIIKRVNEKGLSRSYKIRRDEPIHRLTREADDYDFRQIAPNTEPWKRYVDSLLSGHSVALQEAIETFVDHRNGIRQEDLKITFGHVLSEAVKLPPEALLPLLASWTHDLSEAQLHAHRVMESRMRPPVQAA